MKLLSVLAVGVAGYTSLNDINIDPKDPMSGLSMMMATAQQSLGRAQRHHQKVVDKMRKRVESNFNSEADSVGGVIAELSQNLSVADSRLQAAINVSMAGLKKEEAAPSKLDDWMDPGVAERARLNAEINSAERILQHSLLAHQRTVTEAEDNAGQAFEDQSMRLGMKLGDLTEQSDKAKKEIETLVSTKGEATSAAQANSSRISGKDQQARLKQYEALLTTVQKESQVAASAAQTRFTQFLSKATNIVTQESDKVLGDLEAAQQQEISKVRGQKKTTVTQKTHDAKASQRAAIHKYAMNHHGHMPSSTTTTTTTSTLHRAAHKRVSKPKQAVKTTTTHTTTTLSPAQKASAHKNHKKHTK